MNMFEVVDYLCKREHISIAQMCREIGMRPSIITDLKHGRTKNLSHENMLKIANHFQVSMDVFNEGILEETYPSQADIDSVAGYHYLKQKEKHTTANSDKPLSEDPLVDQIIEKLNGLSPELKKVALAQLDSLTKLQDKKDK